MGLKEARLASWEFAAKILVSTLGGDAAAWRAIEHADLHEVRLVHLLDGIFFFAQRGGKRAEAHGTAPILVEQGNHQVAVDFIQSMLIDAEHVQGFASHFPGDAAGGAHLSEITSAAEQAVGNARRTAATSGDFFGTAFFHLDVQNPGGAAEDDEQIFRLIKIEAMDDPEAGAQRRSNQSGARGGPDKCEVIQVEGMDSSAWSLTDDEIDTKIFHGGIQNFLDGSLEPMDFVEKKNFLGLEGSEDRGEIPFPFEKRPGTGFYGHIQFIRNDLG